MFTCIQRHTLANTCVCMQQLARMHASMSACACIQANVHASLCMHAHAPWWPGGRLGAQTAAQVVHFCRSGTFLHASARVKYTHTHTKASKQASKHRATKPLAHTFRCQKPTRHAYSELVSWASRSEWNNSVGESGWKQHKAFGGKWSIWRTWREMIDLKHLARNDWS